MHLLDLLGPLENTSLGEWVVHYKVSVQWGPPENPKGRDQPGAGVKGAPRSGEMVQVRIKVACRSWRALEMADA